MWEFFRTLFGTDFMPHLYCLRGDPGVLWLHVVSDGLIAASYYAIPFVLLRVILKRKELLFRWVAVLFGLFIGACGTTHVLAVWTIWSPMYRLEGLMKGVTAAVSVTTALVLMRLKPRMEQLPSIAELEREIRERRRAEAEAREKEERFRSFVESVQDYAIYRIDLEGKIETWNSGAERMKGYRASEILGERFSIFYAPEELALGKPEETLRRVRETGRFEGEGWRVRKDGSRFLAHVVVRPLLDEAGELRGYSKVTRDLTETRELEARFQILLEAAPDPIVIVRKDAAIDYVNAQAERLFGYRRSEVLGKSVDMLLPPKLREVQGVARDWQLHEPGHPLAAAPGEIWGMRKDGSEFPLEFSLSPLDTRDGRLMLFAVRDLTEKLRTEARFRAVLEAAPDAIVINNRGGRIVYINRRAEEMFGYERGVLLGRPVDLLIPERMREDRRRKRELFFEDPSLSETGLRAEYWCLRAAGIEFEVEASRSLLETADGPLVLSSIRDLTQRRRADLRFRNLLESAPDAMVISGEDGRIQLANLQAERLFGYERGEMQGQPVQMLIPQDLHGHYERDVEEFYRGDFSRAMGEGLELRAKRRDGTEIPVEIRFSPLEGEDGHSMTAAIRDISERRQASQLLAEKMRELRQSNEALEQFAHIASHDLQEPLRMVASFIQLLQRRYKGRLDADADEFIAYAVDGTRRMKRLIEDLLLYSRAGKGGPPQGEVPVREALETALRNLSAAIEESGAEVTHDPLPTLSASETQLTQVFQNLVGNALKYRGEGRPRVHISAKAEGKDWVFSVKDNGIGIDAQFFDRIFLVFHRLHGHREYEGTGIGLAICKRILQQSGGSIWVESELGQGSTFYFSLPGGGSELPRRG